MGRRERGAGHGLGWVGGWVGFLPPPRALMSRVFLMSCAKARASPFRLASSMASSIPSSTSLVRAWCWPGCRQIWGRWVGGWVEIG